MISLFFRRAMAILLIPNLLMAETVDRRIGVPIQQPHIVSPAFLFECESLSVPGDMTGGTPIAGVSEAGNIRTSTRLFEPGMGASHEEDATAMSPAPKPILTEEQQEQNKRSWNDVFYGFPHPLEEIVEKETPSILRALYWIDRLVSLDPDHPLLVIQNESLGLAYPPFNFFSPEFQDSLHIQWVNPDQPGALDVSARLFRSAVKIPATSTTRISPRERERYQNLVTWAKMHHMRILFIDHSTKGMNKAMEDMRWDNDLWDKNLDFMVVPNEEGAWISFNDVLPSPKTRVYLLNTNTSLRPPSYASGNPSLLDDKYRLLFPPMGLPYYDPETGNKTDTATYTLTALAREAEKRYQESLPTTHPPAPPQTFHHNDTSLPLQEGLLVLKTLLSSKLAQRERSKDTRPVLVVICGRPGTGKSTLAKYMELGRFGLEENAVHVAEFDEPRSMTLIEISQRYNRLASAKLIIVEGYDIVPTWAHEHAADLIIQLVADDQVRQERLSGRGWKEQYTLDLLETPELFPARSPDLILNTTQSPSAKELYALLSDPLPHLPQPINHDSTVIFPSSPAEEALQLAAEVFYSALLQIFPAIENHIPENDRTISYVQEWFGEFFLIEPELGIAYKSVLNAARPWIPAQPQQTISTGSTLHDLVGKIETGLEALDMDFPDTLQRAFLEVDRRHYLENAALAGEDWFEPMPAGNNTTQPSSIAWMILQALPHTLLEQKGPLKILTVGTGTGYAEAVMAHYLGIVRPEFIGQDHIISVEAIRALAVKAGELARELGYDNTLNIYSPAQHPDGTWIMGWPEEQPYDAVLSFAQTSDPEKRAALAQQLKPGGRLIIPWLTEWAMASLVVYERGLTNSEEIMMRECTRIAAVSFTPLTSTYRPILTEKWTPPAHIEIDSSWDGLQIASDNTGKPRVGITHPLDKATNPEVAFFPELLEESLRDLDIRTAGTEAALFWKRICRGRISGKSIPLRVAKELGINALKHIRSDGSTEILLDSDFVHDLLANYIQTSWPSKRKAAIWILAERLFHELGHSETMLPAKEESHEEQERIFEDVMLHASVFPRRTQKQKIIDGLLQIPGLRLHLLRKGYEESLEQCIRHYYLTPKPFHSGSYFGPHGIHGMAEFWQETHDLYKLKLKILHFVKRRIDFDKLAGQPYKTMATSPIDDEEDARAALGFPERKRPPNNNRFSPPPSTRHPVAVPAQELPLAPQNTEGATGQLSFDFASAGPSVPAPTGLTVRTTDPPLRGNPDGRRNRRKRRGNQDTSTWHWGRALDSQSDPKVGVAEPAMRYTPGENISVVLNFMIRKGIVYRFTREGLLDFLNRRMDQDPDETYLDFYKRTEYLGHLRLDQLSIYYDPDILVRGTEVHGGLINAALIVRFVDPAHPLFGAPKNGPSAPYLWVSREEGNLAVLKFDPATMSFVADSTLDPRRAQDISWRLLGSEQEPGPIREFLMRHNLQQAHALGRSENRLGLLTDLMIQIAHQAPLGKFQPKVGENGRKWFLLDWNLFEPGWDEMRRGVTFSEMRHAFPDVQKRTKTGKFQDHDDLIAEPLAFMEWCEAAGTIDRILEALERSEEWDLIGTLLIAIGQLRQWLSLKPFEGSNQDVLMFCKDLFPLEYAHFLEKIRTEIQRRVHEMRQAHSGLCSPFRSPGTRPLRDQFANWFLLYQNKRGQLSDRLQAALLPEGTEYYHQDRYTSMLTRSTFGTGYLQVFTLEDGSGQNPLILDLGEADAVRIPLSPQRPIFVASSDYYYCNLCLARGYDALGHPYLVQWHYLLPEGRLPTPRSAQEAADQVLLGIPKLLHDLTHVSLIISGQTSSISHDAPDVIQQKLNGGSPYIDSVVLIPRPWKTVVSVLANQDAAALWFKRGPFKGKFTEEGKRTSAQLISDSSFLIIPWDTLKTGIIDPPKISDGTIPETRRPYDIGVRQGHSGGNISFESQALAVRPLSPLKQIAGRSIRFFSRLLFGGFIPETRSLEQTSYSIQNEDLAHHVPSVSFRRAGNLSGARAVKEVTKRVEILQGYERDLDLPPDAQKRLRNLYGAVASNSRIRRLPLRSANAWYWNLSLWIRGYRRWHDIQDLLFLDGFLFRCALQAMAGSHNILPATWQDPFLPQRQQDWDHALESLRQAFEHGDDRARVVRDIQQESITRETLSLALLNSAEGNVADTAFQFSRGSAHLSLIQDQRPRLLSLLQDPSAHQVDIILDNAGGELLHDLLLTYILLRMGKDVHLHAAQHAFLRSDATDRDVQEAIDALYHYPSDQGPFDETLRHIGATLDVAILKNQRLHTHPFWTNGESFSRLQRKGFFPLGDILGSRGLLHTLRNSIVILKGAHNYARATYPEGMTNHTTPLEDIPGIRVFLEFAETRAVFFLKVSKGRMAVGLSPAEIQAWGSSPSIDGAVFIQGLRSARLWSILQRNVHAIRDLFSPIEPARVRFVDAVIRTGVMPQTWPAVRRLLVILMASQLLWPAASHAADMAQPMAPSGLLYEWFPHPAHSTRALPTIVVVPPWGYSSSDFKDYAQQLHGRGISAHVVAVNLRGQGLSNVPGTMGIQDVDHLHRTLKLLRQRPEVQDQPIILHGISLGAAVAVQMLTQDSQIVQGFIGEACLADLAATLRRFVVQRIEEHYGNELRERFPGDISPTALFQLADDTIQLVRRYIGYRLDPSAQLLHPLGEIDTLSVPLCLLYGEIDSLINSGEQADMAAAAEGRTHWLPLGHLLFNQDNPIYWDILQEFIEKTLHFVADNPSDYRGEVHTRASA